MRVETYVLPRRWSALQNRSASAPSLHFDTLTRCLFKNHQGRKPLTVVAFLLTFCLWLPVVAANAGEILLTSSGNGQWQVSATELNNVHALDLQLNYDPQRLSGLTATAGAGLSGAMSAINDKIPGAIRLGAITSRPLPQSGILLNLQSSAPGAELVVSSFTVKTVDADGKVVPSTVRQQLPIQSPPAQTPPDTLTEAIKNPTSSQPLIVTPRRGGSVSGSVTLPNEAFPVSAERTPPPSPSTPAPEQWRTATPAIRSAAGPPAASGLEKRFHSQEEIVTAIDRLPQPWTVAAIKAIFLKPATASQVRQVPAVVLADGKSRVSLYLPKSLSQKTPTVGVQGCTLGSIWDAKEQGWEVELITRKGNWPGKALLMGEGDLIQFPVVIVPALTIIPPASDNATIPAVDFDTNGSITALDAYLYVGNLLAR